MTSSVEARSPLVAQPATSAHDIISAYSLFIVVSSRSTSLNSLPRSLAVERDQGQGSILGDTQTSATEVLLVDF
jgi:hypothetical protein